MSVLEARGVDCERGAPTAANHATVGARSAVQPELLTLQSGGQQPGTAPINDSRTGFSDSVLRQPLPVQALDTLGLTGESRLSSASDLRAILEGSGQTPSEQVTGYPWRPRALDTPKRRYNLYLFLQKLDLRRKRIPCSRVCWTALNCALKELCRKQSDDGRLSADQICELRRAPPKGVRLVEWTSVTRHLEDAGRSYDEVGDGRIAPNDLLQGAVEVEPSSLVRHKGRIQILVLLVWLALSLAVYCPIAKWTVVDALYFAIVTLFTVGYGDLNPDTDELKIFTIFYILSGVTMLTWIIADFMDSAVQRQEARLMGMLERQDMDRFADDKSNPSKAEPSLGDLASPHRSVRNSSTPIQGRACTAADRGQESSPMSGTRSPKSPSGTSIAGRGAGVGSLLEVGNGSAGSRVSHAHSEAELLKTKRQRIARVHQQTVMKVVISLNMIIMFLALGTVIIYFADGLTLIDALYWSVATCTTVGYGSPVISDSVPTRVCTMLFILVSVPSFAYFIGQLGEAHLQARSLKREAEALSRTLSPAMLMDLDADGDGVDKVEFLCAMLMALNKVSAHDLWKILDQFDRLDHDGSGVLDQNDLQELRRDTPGNEKISGRGLQASPSKDKGLGDVPVSATPQRRQLQHSSSSASTLDGGLNGREPDASPIPSLRGNVSGALTPSVRFAEEVQGQSSVRFAHEVLTLGSDITQMTEASTQQHSNVIQQDDPKLRQQLDDLYQENIKLRQHMEIQTQELVSVMQAMQQSELSLRQVAVERQALHGETSRLQHTASELQGLLHEERTQREDVQHQCEDALRLRCVAEAALQETQKHLRDVESQLREQVRILETRAVQAEMLVLERDQHLKDADSSHKNLEYQFRLEMEARERQIELHCAEMDVRQRNEVTVALMELKSIAQGQQALRCEVARSRPPPAFPLMQSHSSAKVRVHSGQQPAEMWERSAIMARGAAHRNQQQQMPLLLSGKIKSQVDFINNQVRQLEDRLPQDDPPPGWV